MATTTRDGTLRGWGYMAPARDRVHRDPIPVDAIEAGYVHAHDFADPVRVGEYVVSEAELREHLARNGTMPARMVHMDFSGSYMYVNRIAWLPEEVIAWTEERDMRPCATTTT